MAADRHSDPVRPVPGCFFIVFAVTAAQSDFVSGNALTAITAGADEKRQPYRGSVANAGVQKVLDKAVLVCYSK